MTSLHWKMQTLQVIFLFWNQFCFEILSYDIHIVFQRSWWKRKLYTTVKKKKVSRGLSHLLQLIIVVEVAKYQDNTSEDLFNFYRLDQHRRLGRCDSGYPLSTNHLLVTREIFVGKKKANWSSDSCLVI